MQRLVWIKGGCDKWIILFQRRKKAGTLLQILSPTLRLITLFFVCLRHCLFQVWGQTVGRIDHWASLEANIEEWSNLDPAYDPLEAQRRSVVFICFYSNPNALKKLPIHIISTHLPVEPPFLLASGHIVIAGNGIAEIGVDRSEKLTITGVSSHF